MNLANLVPLANLVKKIVLDVGVICSAVKCKVVETSNALLQYNKVGV